MDDFIYLDNNATTKPDPKVVEAMLPFFKNYYANASSGHLFGLTIQEEVEKARQQVAKLINASAKEIIFTAGATEAINLAIKGLAANYPDKKHIVTLATEHKAVLDTCEAMQKTGYEITYIPLNSDGLVDVQHIKDSIREDTLLVTVMYANNETGVLQPLHEIAETVQHTQAFFMTDATQAVGKIPVDVHEMQIDIMPFSAHKFYGPKGIGALYVNYKGNKKVKLSQQISGGGQERGMRSGTLNVPGIIGMGMACKIARAEMHQDEQRIIVLRNYLEKNLLKITDTYLNGNVDKRLFNTSNICLKNINADTLIMRLGKIAVSSGSACSAVSTEPSLVLKAMGLSNEDALSSIRFSLGRFTTEDEIKMTINKVETLIKELRINSYM